jgi:hypothetical protein
MILEQLLIDSRHFLVEGCQDEGISRDLGL